MHDLILIGVDYTPGSTVATGIGQDMETGDQIFFAGDWRPMSDLADLLEHMEDDIEIQIEDWQILRRIPAGAGV